MASGMEYRLIQSMVSKQGNRHILYVMSRLEYCKRNRLFIYRNVFTGHQFVIIFQDLTLFFLTVSMINLTSYVLFTWLVHSRLTSYYMSFCIIIAYGSMTGNACIVEHNYAYLLRHKFWSSWNSTLPYLSCLVSF